MIPDPFAGLIFNFEGTLAELNINFQLMKRQVSALAGVFLERRVSPATLPVHEWIGVLAEELGRVNPSVVKEFLSRCGMLVTAVEMKAALKGSLFPLTFDVIDILKRRQKRIGVISSSCSAAVRVIFPNIDKECDVFLAREDVDKVKPDPGHWLSAIEGMGLSENACLMVSDNLPDIETAKKLNVKCAAVASGNIGEKELTAAHPDFLSSNVLQLIKHLIALRYI